MTWKEFKNYVDNELKEKGQSEDIELDYIDCTNPSFEYNYSKPEVAIDKDGIAIF